MKPFPSSELVLNADGSVYHLKLQPEQIADDIIVVGDQGRVEEVSRNFDSVECRIQNREFITHTGMYRGKRISVISTGIGTDNIDIVLNELDSLVNIDLKERLVKSTLKSLRIVRIGTSGTLMHDIPVDSVITSSHGLGFDGLMHFYQFAQKHDDIELADEIAQFLELPHSLNKPYVCSADDDLFERLRIGFHQGITATASGFYGPQGRKLRIEPAVPDLNERMMQFTSRNGHHITNFEMETSALYGLSSALGHKACTLCVIIANRARLEYSKNYKPTMNMLIGTVLDRLSE
jgi:uridine phosphorylase